MSSYSFQSAPGIAGGMNSQNLPNYQSILAYVSERQLAALSVCLLFAGGHSKTVREPGRLTKMVTK